MPPYLIPTPGVLPSSTSTSSTSAIQSRPDSSSIPSSRILPVARSSSGSAPAAPVSSPAPLVAARPVSIPLCSRPYPAQTSPAAFAAGVVLFRNDLRIHDHTSLEAAFKRSPEAPRTPALLYVFDPVAFGSGTTQRSVHDARFLLQAVDSLREQVRARGGVLLIRRGNTTTALAQVCDQLDAKVVYVGVTGQDDVAADHQMRNDLEKRGIELVATNADAISTLRTNSGGTQATEAQSLSQQSTQQNTDIQLGALEFRDHPERIVDFLDQIPAPETLKDAPGDHLDHGTLPSLEQLGYKTSDINATPSKTLGGIAHARKAISNPHPSRGRCSCSLAKYLSFGCISRRELFSYPQADTGLDQNLVRGELLWNEYWRLRHATTRKRALAPAPV